MNLPVDAGLPGGIRLINLSSPLGTHDAALFRPAPHDSFRCGDGLRGLAVLRPCREGSKIGPLFAEDPVAARALFAALLAAAPTGPVFLDLPEPNADALAMARDAGMAPAFETARMYAGAAPVLPLHRVYGITSFELG